MNSTKLFTTVPALCVLLFSFVGVSAAQGDSCVPGSHADLYLEMSVKEIATGSAQSADPGSVLEYTMEYGNIGNRAAERAVISEIIPEGTSYVSGSLAVPPGATAAFSPAESDPDSFEIRFSAPLQPADTFWWQGLAGHWFMNESTDIAVSPEPFGHVEDSPNNLDAMTFGFGDFDKDSRADAVAVYNYKWEELYFGYGNGTFEDATTLQINDFPVEGEMDIAVADFNEDGHDDIIIVGPDVDSEFYAGNGDGTMYGTKPFPSTNSPPHASSVVVGDFNNDHRLDVVMGSWGRNNELFIGNGDGTFQRGMTDINDFGPQQTTDAAAGDLDNDGNLDLVFANNGFNEIYLGYGSGVFDFGTTVCLNGNGAIRSNALALADLDSDGNLDVIVGNDGSDEIYFGRGDGTFKPVRTDILNAYGARRTTFIEAKDVNNDGRIDLLVGPGELYLNKGRGVFKSIVPLSYYTYAGGLCDFSGDGYLDIISVGGVHLNQSGECGYVEPTAELGTVTSPVIAPASRYPDSGDLLSWDALLVEDYIPAGTDITYDILDISGAPIPGFEWLTPDADGMISLSGLSSSVSEIRVRANLFTVGAYGATPSLCRWELVFSMEEEHNAKVTFRLRVDGASLTRIDNTARIDSDTPDNDPDNNVDSASIDISSEPSPPPPDGSPPNYIELRIRPNAAGGYEFYPGERVVLDWEAHHDLYRYTNVPCAVYFGVARYPVDEDKPVSVQRMLQSGELFVFDNSLRPLRYRGNISRTWEAVPFPVPNGIGSSGSIAFTAPVGAEGRWVFAAGFVTLDGNGFPAEPPVEVSNGFTLH